MPNEVKLEVYSVRIRRSRDVSNFLQLDSFDGDNDFLSFLQTYIQSFDHQIELNENQGKTLKLSSNSLRVLSEQRIISGIIESGDYGYESDFYNTESGEHRYRREIEDTEIMPFYFLMYLPADGDKGFVILQRFGVHGIHGIFKTHLTEFFKGRYENLMLDFDPFISRGLAQAFIDNGNIREFSLTRYNLSSDIADNLGMRGHAEDIMSISISIKAKRNSSLPIGNKVRRFVENPNARIFTLRELDSLGFNGDHKSKMKVQLGNDTRTIDLADSGQIRPYYDIDNDVQKHPSGHPVFDSINDIAKGLLNDLIIELGI